MWPFPESWERFLLMTPSSNGSLYVDCLVYLLLTGVSEEWEKKWRERSVVERTGKVIGSEVVVDPIDHSIAKHIDDSIDDSITESINESINKPISESINESITNPINESINQPLINRPINQPFTNQTTKLTHPPSFLLGILLFLITPQTPSIPALLSLLLSISLLLSLSFAPFLFSLTQYTTWFAILTVATSHIPPFANPVIPFVFDHLLLFLGVDRDSSCVFFALLITLLAWNA